jgi:hypothetical protein
MVVASSGLGAAISFASFSRSIRSYSAFLTATASNSFVTVPASAVCLGMARLYGLKPPGCSLRSLFLLLRFASSYSFDRPWPVSSSS